MQPTPRLWVLPLLILSLLASPLMAQGPVEELEKQQEDTRLYLETIDMLKDNSLENQIKGWEKFLKEHPDNYFRDEIEANLDNMKARQEIIAREQEEQDSRRYFATVERAADKPVSEQIPIWEKYLKENPDSLFANEARTTLNRLRLQAGPAVAPAQQPLPSSPPPPAPLPTAPPTVETTAKDLTLQDDGLLDPNRALFLASVPGLIVPGLGHFYAGNYTIGGVLVGLRVGGLALMGYGFFDENRLALIIPGSLVAGFSYVLDVVMAPIQVRNRNHSLEPLPPLEGSQLRPLDQDHPFAKAEQELLTLTVGFSF